MKNLIPLSYLNEACFLSLNVDEKKYNMVLKLAQDDLKDILGPEFYQEIEDDYPSSLSTDNANLYEGYIKDYLAWQTYMHYTGFSNLSETPTGPRVFIEENSTLATDVQKYSLEQNIKRQLVRYKNRMINYLNESQVNDSTKYPLWYSTCRDEMSFSISAVDKKSDAVIKVNRATRYNEQ